VLHVLVLETRMSSAKAKWMDVIRFPLQLLNVTSMN